MISKECLYESGAEEYMENQTLVKKNNQVRCECDVIYPGENSPEHRKVADISGTCTLRVLRCPTSVLLVTQ